MKSVKLITKSVRLISKVCQVDNEKCQIDNEICHFDNDKYVSLIKLTHLFHEVAVMLTFDRDDVEIIKAPSYKFFKGCLDNKIVDYKIEEQEDLKHKIEMDLFW